MTYSGTNKHETTHTIDTEDTYTAYTPGDDDLEGDWDDEDDEVFDDLADDREDLQDVIVEENIDDPDDDDHLPDESF